MAFEPNYLIDAGPAALRITLCKITELQRWGARSMRSPFWRCYCPITEGAKVVFDDQEIPLTPGAGMLISPYTDFGAVRLKPFTKAYCHFTYELPGARVSPGVYPFEVDREILAALTAMASAPVDRHAEIRLLRLLLEQTSHALRRLPQSSIVLTPGGKRFRTSVSLMKQNLAAPLSNGQLADVVNLHENSFVRYFGRVAGESPQKYYRRLRLEHACHLLITTEDSIEQIAEACGFWDRNHFSRAFRKQWHIPPAAFRRQNR